MSLTFTLSGNTSQIHTVFREPIRLQAGVRYCVGLVRLEFQNTLIFLKNKTITFTPDSSTNDDIITKEIPDGAYSVKSLEQCLQNLINKEVNFFKEDCIRLKFDTDTQKFHVISKFVKLNFSSDSSLHDIFNIDQTSYPVNNEIVSKDKFGRGFVHDTQMLMVHCNIGTGSFFNDTPQYLIYDLCLNGREFGVWLREEPANIMYLPINTDTINFISIHLCNRDGAIVNLRDLPIILKLHIKEWDSVSSKVTGDTIKRLHFH